jgi:RNA polymerase-binding transcription factor DksA
MNTTSNRDEFHTYRTQLESLAARLSGGVAQLTADATRPTGAEELTGARSEGDEEVARGVLLAEGELLAEVRKALARFDAGTFGRCEGCGRPIGKARLTALPYARDCIRCAGSATGAQD